jgi:hypothetical protein
MISQKSTKQTAQANEAFIGERLFSKPEYRKVLSCISEPSFVFQEIMFKILGINPEAKNTVMALTP